MSAVFEALPPREAIAAMEARGFRLDPSFSWLDVWQEEHARAFTVAKSAGFDILKDIHGSLLDALKDGKTFRDFAKELRPVLEKKGWWGRKIVADPLTGERRAVQLGSTRRLRTIFDTNMRVSYAAGHWDRIQRTKATRPFLRYVHLEGQEHPRVMHHRWHNTVLPIDHPWWHTHATPNGFGCHCTIQQLSQRDIDRLIAQGEDLKFEPPDDGERTYVNRRTGEVSVVPDGIDPGWAYNPGAQPHRVVERLNAKMANGLLFDDLPRLWPKPPATHGELETLAEELADGQQAWADALSEVELDAIENYKAAGHRYANAVLRGTDDVLEEMDESDRDLAETIIEGLSSALAAARIPKAITTFRGIPPGALAQTGLDKLKPGDIVADAGFFSSSLSEEIARNRFGVFVVECRLLKGTKAAAFVHFIPDVNHVEYEVVMAPGTRMKVVERAGDRLIVEVMRE